MRRLRVLARVVASILAFVLLPLPTRGAQVESRVSIDHKSVGCVVAERFPRLEARVGPLGEIGRVKCLFRPTGTAPWYAVVMRPEGGVHTATLPKPQKSLAAFDYYIEAVDREFGVVRTPEHRSQVVHGEAECAEASGVAASAGAASIVVESPAGAPAVPAGFGNAGVVAATGAAGGGGAAVVTTAAGAAAAGGMGATTLLVGGVAAAGAAAAVVATRGDDTPATTLPPPPPATGHWTGTFFERDAIGECTANWSLTMDVVDSNGSLSGTMTLRGVSATTGIYTCAGNPGEEWGPGTLSGSIAGTAVHFLYSFLYNTRVGNMTHVFDGAITSDRKSMQGTWVWQGAETTENGTWTAARQ